MPQPIEKLVQKILKHAPQSSHKEFSWCCQAMLEIGSAAQKKKSRPEALDALRRILAEGSPRMQRLTANCLKNLATADSADLEADFRDALANPLTSLDAAGGLVRVVGEKAWPAVVDAIADKALGLTARVQLLDWLSHRTRQSWNQAIPPRLGDIQEKHFSLKKLRTWVAEGCPMQTAPLAFPTAKLKRQKIELPGDYRSHIENPAAELIYRDRSGREWFLFPAAHLFAERDYLQLHDANILLSRAVGRRERENQNIDTAKERAAVERMERGVAFGINGNDGPLLFFDPAENFAVYTLEPPFSQVKRQAGSFSEWRKKLKSMPLPDDLDRQAIATLVAHGASMGFDDEAVAWVTIGKIDVADAILDALRRLPGLPNLVWCRTDDRRIDDAMRVVATLIYLDRLSLNHTPLTDKGLRHLTTLWDVEKLDLYETKVTAKGIAALRESLPNAEFVTEDPYPMCRSSDDDEDDSDDDEQWETYRCPVSACPGMVTLVEDEDDGDFWGCGECGGIWRKKKNLYAEITAIIKKYPYRQACYKKSGKTWLPAGLDNEPDDYEDLVEQEHEDTSEEYERG